MRIPLISCCWSCARISPMRSDGAPSPHSTSMMSTRKPFRWARSIHRWLNWPYRGASTRSPGESVLTSAASHPPVPVAGKMNACPVVVLKRSEEHTSELQSRLHLVCRLLLEKKKKIQQTLDGYGRLV